MTRKLIILISLMLAVMVCEYLLPGNLSFATWYDKQIYYPLQSVRGVALFSIPISAGDLLYGLGGLWGLVTLIRWIIFIVHFRSQKQRLAASVIASTNTILLVYLFFVLGWGANYYKQPLAASWELSFDTMRPTSTATEAQGYPLSKFAKKRLRARDSAAIVAFDSFLVSKLNILAPDYEALPLGEVNKRSIRYYRLYTDSKVKAKGLCVKPTLFGYLMERMAVEGYYNPFTGEGQVNSGLPAFTMPFLVCHEMAHQAGIAAEGDANLMAYAVGTTTADKTFNYSSYLNIWLYTNNRLYQRDSALAHKFEAKLNKLTIAHLDTLEQISRKYHNELARYSGEVYDSYLKMHDQKEGIRSYGDVTISAWQLELRRKRDLNKLIKVP